jgi:hypothetical protein
MFLHIFLNFGCFYVILGVFFFVVLLSSRTELPAEVMLYILPSRLKSIKGSSVSSDRSDYVIPMSDDSDELL